MKVVHGSARQALQDHDFKTLRDRGDDRGHVCQRRTGGLADSEALGPQIKRAVPRKHLRRARTDQVHHRPGVALVGESRKF